MAEGEPELLQEEEEEDVHRRGALLAYYFSSRLFRAVDYSAMKSSIIRFRIACQRKLLRGAVRAPHR